MTAYEREPGGLDDVLGLVLVQAVRPNDVPQHRRETTNQVVERSGGDVAAITPTTEAVGGLFPDRGGPTGCIGCALHGHLWTSRLAPGQGIHTDQE